MKNANDLQQVRAIFDAVAELPEDARGARLAELCAGNEALRAEVEELLGAGERAGAFLSEPAIRPEDALAAPLGLEEGSVIGKYRLLEQIGEGANAVVYMVEQIETLRRRAALKVIKLGMDTREVIARFETERQALAMMDHPNISKVLDAGATASGRPYFVMELVKGIPITDYCDRNKLAMRERLELFIVVCQALLHAHLKGIIHRDVKPSNVLVTLHDGVPVPKVIDFGIAKATESPLTNRTLFTRFHQFIGTPAYMSPEQAEMSGLDIDTRSDIYSLGVLLYELLTGSTPFDGKKLLESGFSEIQRVIRERDPETPSTRVGTLSAEGLTAVASCRSITAGELGGGIRGDLDWIVMKALEKDRTRRYETAGEFMRDVRRHLDNEPVEAGPPSRVYRMRKFVLRHRPAVIAASLVVVSLVAALLIASFGLVRAQREAADARRQAEKADAVTQLLDGMFQSATPGATKGKDFTVRALLDDFSARIGGELESEPEVEMTIRRTVGIAYEGLGEYVRAEPHLRRARELAVEIHGPSSDEALEAEAGLGWLTHELGKPEGAITILEEVAEAQRKKAGAEDPGYLQSLAYLAAARFAVGETEAAELLAKQVLATPSRSNHPNPLWVTQILTEIYRAQGKHAEAEKLSADLIARFEGDQVELGPRTIEALHTAVQGQIKHARYDEAEALIKRGLQTARRTLGDDHLTTLLLLGDLGQVARARGEFGDAVKIYSGVLEEQRRTLGDQHPDTVQTLLALAGLRLEQDENQLAETMAQEAFDTAARRFGEDDVITIESVCELAEAMRRQGKHKQAETILRQSYRIARDSIGDSHPTTLHCARQLGRLHAAQKNFPEAERYFRDVLEKYREKFGSDTEETLLAIEELSDVLDKMYRFAEAQELTAELVEARGSIEDQRRHANLYRKRAIPVPAVELLERTLASATQTHGADAEVSLEIRRDLVEAAAMIPDYGKAIGYANEGLRLATASLGERDPLTRRLQGAANTVEKARVALAKREVSARATYKRVVADGADRSRAWDNWAVALTMIQDAEASAKEVVEYLEYARATYGEEDVNTLNARHLEAWRAKRFSEDARADSLYRELIRDEQRLLDPLDFLLLKTLYSYSDFLLKRDRHEEFDALIDSWQDERTGSTWNNPEILVPRRGPWRFLNHETDEGTGWKEFGAETIPTVSGVPWRTGRAPFGYGTIGMGTAPWQVAGQFSHTTLYFRRSFEVADPARFSAVKIRLLREGGAAVYLNGKEVVRDQLVPDATFNTVSGNTLDLSRCAYYVFLIEPGMLREGGNIVAVEVHQEKPGSEDMAFDLEISGQLREEPVE